MTPISLLEKWVAMEAVTASPLPPAAKLVYFRLLAHMNTKTGRCDPSYGTLARGTNLSRPHLIKQILVLTDSGLIEVDKGTGGRPNDPSSVNRYKIILPDSSNNFLPGAVRNSYPNTGIEHGKETGNLNTGNEHTPQAPRGRRFPVGDDGPDIDDSFRSFWKQYPRKVNEKKARAAYARAIRSGASPDMITQAAMRYAAERSGQEERYTAHAATWLDNRRWEDEAPRRDRGTVLDAAGNVIEFPAPKQSFDSYDDAELDRLARICKTGKYRP